VEGGSALLEEPLSGLEATWGAGRLDPVSAATALVPDDSRQR
jgi:hypothetical protein